MRFVVFALISIIPMLGFNWLLIAHHNSVRYQDLVNSQTMISSQISNSLTGYLSGSFKSLESLASTSVLVEGTDSDAITTLLSQARTIRPGYSGVFMLTADEHLVAQAGVVDETVIQAVSAQTEGVLASGSRTISGRIDLPLDPTTSVFVMLVPITLGSEVSTSSGSGTNASATPESAPDASESQVPGTVTGVLGAIMPTDGLNQVSLPAARGRSEMVILAGNQIITAAGDTRANEDAFITNLLAQNEAITEEGTDVFRMRSVTGTERSAVWMPLPFESSNWSVLVTTPIPGSELSALWQQLVAILGVVILVYLALAYTFGELTSRSLSDLTESAKRLAEGDYRTPVAQRGSGELTELRDALVQLRENTEVVMIDSEDRQEERLHQYEQLRDLLRRDLRMQEDERRHIAAEIHDAVSPLITGALYQSRALQRANGGTTHEMIETTLSDVNNLLERASEELHGIIFDLRPPDLDDLGVVAAIEAFVGTIRRTGLDVRLEVIDQPPALSPEVRLGIYRIVQEALHNVLRHAGADEAVVRMEYINQMMRVTIRDNGAGFDTGGARRPTSLGLLSMRERAAAIGADFEIMSRPGGGTVIIVERRDTGAVMSDALLDAILRDRTEAELENLEDLPDTYLGGEVMGTDLQR